MKLGFFLKIAILVISLIGVIYIMRLLRTSEVDNNKQLTDSNSVVGLLVGGDYRLLNWCPEGLKKIEIYSEAGEVVKVLDSKHDFVAVCELMVGGLIQDSSYSPKYRPKLKAYPESGGPVTLEMDWESRAFQVKGMPFSSPGLIKALDRLSTP